MSLRVCAGCSTQYSVDLLSCPHCGSSECLVEGVAVSRRLPSFVVVSCDGCGRGPWTVRLTGPLPGLFSLPALFCTSCGCQVQVPWPPVEDSMPKITVHGGATNARADETSPVASASLPPVVAEGGRGPSSDTVPVGEPGPELAGFEHSADGTESPEVMGDGSGEVLPELDDVQDETEAEQVPEYDYDTMTLAELRAAAEDRGVPSYGTKAQIAERLREADGETE